MSLFDQSLHRGVAKADPLQAGLGYREVVVAADLTLPPDSRDILGCDIKLTSFDFTTNSGDIDLVSGVYCLKQDLLDAMLTPYFYWGHSLDFGSRLIEFVEGSKDPLYVAELRAAAAEVFEAEVRVERDSWDIQLFWLPDSVELEMMFWPIESETPASMAIITIKRGL